MLRLTRRLMEDRGGQILLKKGQEGEKVDRSSIKAFATSNPQLSMLPGDDAPLRELNFYGGQMSLFEPKPLEMPTGDPMRTPVHDSLEDTCP